MKEIKSRKKSGFFKKVFVKICRILGYELIDQSSLEFPVSNKKSDDTLSVPGVKSFSLGVGEFPITRKVQGIDIIVKTCLLYTSPSPRDQRGSRMPSSA